MKPTVLIGLTGTGKLFTPEILAEMGANNELPIIFAMSNPTSRQECTAAEAQQYTGMPLSRAHHCHLLTLYFITTYYRDVLTTH